MYPVSSEYKEKIQEITQLLNADIKIYHSKGILELSDEDIVEGSLIYNESSQSGEDYTIGGVVASDISFSILNKPEYDNITFVGASVFVNIGLLIREGFDTTFIQPFQPSKTLDSDDLWEYVPLGKFNIDIADRSKNTINIKAIDNMINLNKPYSLSKLSYPATLHQIYTNICDVADVPIGTLNFVNDDYVVKSRPNDEYSLRDILSYVAELSGSFARFNRNGALELTWYKPSELKILPKNRFDLKASDDLVQIKGVIYSTDEEIYISGSDEYAIDLSENPLLQDNYDIVLPNILDNVKDVIFSPYTASWQGNPAVQAGDMLVHEDVDGKIYNSIVTHSTYKYRGKCTISAKGLPQISKGYTGSMDKRIAQIIRRTDEIVGDKLTNLEQAQLNATELMANMLGGYVIQDRDNGILYIADNPKLENATKMWKWGINGFGYSDDGGQTWTTAVTADGSIVANLITAGIITADMVRTGVLESENGKSTFNLNDGSILIRKDSNTPLLYFNGEDTLTFGSGVTINWNQLKDIPDNLAYDEDIPDEDMITQITNNTISTTNVNARNLKVNSANIQGKLTASQIDVTGISRVYDLTNPKNYVEVSNGKFKMITFDRYDMPHTFQMYYDIEANRFYIEQIAAGETKSISFTDSVYFADTISVEEMSYLYGGAFIGGNLSVNGDIYNNGYKIIDSGTNSYGKYIKFSDGTMICTGTHSYYISSLTQLATSGLYTHTTGNFRFAATFKGTPHYVSVRGNAGEIVSMNNRQVTSSYVNSRMLAINDTQVGNYIDVQVFAIGEW